MTKMSKLGHTKLTWDKKSKQKTKLECPNFYF